MNLLKLKKEVSESKIFLNIAWGWEAECFFFKYWKYTLFLRKKSTGVKHFAESDFLIKIACSCDPWKTKCSFSFYGKTTCPVWNWSRFQPSGKKLQLLRWKTTEKSESCCKDFFSLLHLFVISYKVHLLVISNLFSKSKAIITAYHLVWNILSRRISISTRGFRSTQDQCSIWV